MSSQYGELGTVAAEIGWFVWGTPANFNGFRVLASLLHRRRSTEVNQTLHDVRPSHALVVWYTIYRHTFSGALANGILSGAKFTLRPSLALSYIGSVTAWHSSHTVVWDKEGSSELSLLFCTTYIRKGSHHVGHRPTLYLNGSEFWRHFNLYMV